MGSTTLPYLLPAILKRKTRHAFIVWYGIWPKSFFLYGVFSVAWAIIAAVSLQLVTLLMTC